MSQIVDRRIGEVVEASTTMFVVQCHELYNAPDLGSLVRIGDVETIYGIVAEVSTQSLDPGRRAMVMGREEESVEAVYEQNPQLARLLSTEFHAIVVAHRRDDQVNQFIAPVPPRIHDIVYTCDGSELLGVFPSLELLPTLLSSPIGSPDDITAAFLRRLTLEHSNPEKMLVEAGRELAYHLSNQITRLNGILRRLSS